jgi:hypothetical protein
VRPVMKRESLRAIQPKRFAPRTTDSQHGVRVSPNLLKELIDAPRQAGARRGWRYYLCARARRTLALSGDLSGQSNAAHHRVGSISADERRADGEGVTHGIAERENSPASDHPYRQRFTVCRGCLSSAARSARLTPINERAWQL